MTVTEVKDAIATTPKAAKATEPKANKTPKGFESLDEFKSFVRDMCVNGSAIDADLFDAAVEFHQDVEVGYGGDASTPIHDALGWKSYTRFTHKAKPNIYAALLKNEDGSVWQGIVSFPDGEKRYSYLAPKANGDKCFFPPIPPAVREKMSDKLGVDIPLTGSFWEFIRNSPELPRILTEGGKKALAGLSAGYVAIALYGCTCGVEKPDDLSADNLLKSDLEGLALPDSRWLVCLDKDVKATAKKAVSISKRKLFNVLASYGSHVVDMGWKPTAGKGLDDFILKNGENRFDFIYQFHLSKLGEKLGDSPKEEKLSYCQLVEHELYSQDDYICAANKLYKWEGTYYKYVSDGVEKRRIRDFCNRYYQTCIDKDTGKLAKYYPYAKNSRIPEALDWIKQSYYVDIDKLNPAGINCLNGILQVVWDGDIPDVVLVPHSPDYFYTYPPLVEYNPAADPRDCDRLLDALDAPQRDIFLKVVAASLDLPTVRKFKSRTIRALFLKGNGSNGKDALREAISTILGKQGVTSATLNDFSQYDEGRRFNLSGLIHSRINWSSENSNKVQLDKIQSLKAAITGSPLVAEAKGKDGQDFTPNSVFLFNVNDTPNLYGSTEAIISRYGVIEFKKTYKTNADITKGELEADPRFAYDPLFLRLQVCPALLNRLVASLKDLMKNGIDYSCTSEALQEIQAENSHLFAFMQDVGLGYMPDSYVSANDIWQKLEQWYTDNGTLTYEETSTGKLKAIWADQPKLGDKNIKAINQVMARFRQLLPKAKLASVAHENGKKRIPVLEGVGFIVNKDFSTPISNFSTPIPPQVPPQQIQSQQDFHPNHPQFSNFGGENKNYYGSGEGVTANYNYVTLDDDGGGDSYGALCDRAGFDGTENNLKSDITTNNLGVVGVETSHRADSGDLNWGGIGVEKNLIAVENSLLRMEHKIYRVGDSVQFYPQKGGRVKVGKIVSIDYVGGYFAGAVIAYGYGSQRKTINICGGDFDLIVGRV